MFIIMVKFLEFNINIYLYACDEHNFVCVIITSVFKEYLGESYNKMQGNDVYNDFCFLSCIASSVIISSYALFAT